MDRMKRDLAIALCAIVVTWAGPASAQSRNTEHTLKLDDPANAPTASIDQVAWLAGSWEGDAFGGRFEEYWAPPSAGTMVGTFKLIMDGQATMYELFLIVAEGESLVLKLKHFNADLSAWEEKAEHVSFSLVKLDEGVVFFDGLTYRRKGPDLIQVYLALSRDGEVSEEELLYKAVPGGH